MFIIDWIGTIPISSWEAVLWYLAGGSGVAIVLQVLKNVFKIDSKKIVTFLLGVLSFVPIFADAVVSGLSANPNAIGSGTAYLLTAAVFAHRFAVSPIYTRLQVSLGGVFADAKAYREITNVPAVAPTGVGLPANTAAVPANEFSQL